MLDLRDVVSVMAPAASLATLASLRIVRVGLTPVAPVIQLTSACADPTKLYFPPVRRRSVIRPRLVERLDEGLAAGHRLTLVSAPAGFGKTTLASEWVAGGG